jgi:deoxyribose-phosphate aldolase
MVDRSKSDLSQRDLDRLVREIVDEVLAYLGAAASSGSAAAAKPAIAVLPDRISTPPSVFPPAHLADPQWARMMDHTLLRPDATVADIENLCAEAVRYGFASVCIHPCYVSLAARSTRGSSVKVCTVVGFPLGATLTRVKMYEAEEAIRLGTQEIDVVQNVGAIKSGDDEAAEADMRAVVEACHRGGAICKVILETALLSASEKVRSCLAAQRAGADFVKTSTGFAAAGATVEDVALMRAAVGRSMGVKAAGGIRTLDDMRKMVASGATRIGSSASVKIVEEASRLRPS